MIQLERILEEYLGLPDQIRNDPGERVFALSAAIVRHYLGDTWIDREINPEKRGAGYMKLTSKDPQKARIQTFKLTDLAELFFNLQHIEGFSECVIRMKKSNSPEDSLAELDTARMLHISDRVFRFVVPRGEKGFDYDFDIRFGNLTLCMETKCKIEGTEPSAETLTNALRHARRQLPTDKPGVIVIKIPQPWLDYEGWRT